MPKRTDHQSAFDLNRASWDEVVDTHFKSPMYQADLAELRRRSHCLRPEQVKAVGSVKGKSLIHLQCHMGFETLSWARLGAEAVGLDFSAPAVEVARRLAAELKLPARFVHANVYDALRKVKRKFDVVYVSTGAICWLPDIGKWARIVGRLLKPGGRFVMDEAHPFGDVLDDHPTDRKRLIAKYPYFHTKGIEIRDDGTYADLDADLKHDRCVMWIHPIGSVVNALIDNGLRIDRLNESPLCRWPRYKMVREIDERNFELPPPYTAALPMSYMVVATKVPAGGARKRKSRGGVVRRPTTTPASRRSAR